MQTEGEPIPDKDLPELGLRLWNQIIPQLVKSGVATTIDSPLLNKLCRLYARGMEWDEKIFSLKRLDNNMMKKERISSVIWNDFNRIACKFGLSPADRASIRIEKPKATGIPKRNRKAN